MTATYTWEFPQFDCSPSENGLSDVVKTIHWRITGTDGDYSASVYGSCGLDEADAQNFTAFSSLTKEWAIAAVSEKIDVDQSKASIDSAIADLKSPKTLHVAPPFAA